VAEPDETNDVMYVNRSNETNWMILRLLPYMRRADTPDNAEWIRKWKVLDESFRQMVQGLSNLGKKIADAFIEMMDAKFKFEPSSIQGRAANKATASAFAASQRRRPLFNCTTDPARFPSSAAAIRPPIASDARRRGSASRCAYRCVVEACVCPNSLPIIGRPSPPPAPKPA
jgi:hypothetical protein